jgi:CheY-like chemotaxis protein
MGAARRNVLLVEDDDSIASALVDLLTDEGHQVVRARDGFEALDQLRAEPLPGLMLLDLMMPKMDGYTLRKAQLADPRLASVPTFVLTAGGTEQIRELAVEGWFRKPIYLKSLLAVVDRYCGGDDHRHIVEFFRDPAQLIDNVGGFLAEGLAAGDGAVTVLIPTRRIALEHNLMRRGFDLMRLREEGRLLIADAAQTLELMMRDGQPHPILFTRAITPLVDEVSAASATGRVRAYGEMVDLLWQRGDESQALQLEDCWNRLLDGKPISLYCSYCTGVVPPSVVARHTRAFAS